MYDFNQALLSLGIGIVAAQHLEGGPEAKLCLKIGDVRVEMFGTYESSSAGVKAHKALQTFCHLFYATIG